LEKTIKAFIDYIQRNEEIERLSSPNAINDTELRIVIIRILAWLRLEYQRSIWISEGRKTCHKPLVLSNYYNWCNNLRYLVNTESIFYESFMIQNNEFQFNKNILEKDREEARKIVYNNYDLQWHK